MFKIFLKKSLILLGIIVFTAGNLLCSEENKSSSALKQERSSQTDQPNKKRYVTIKLDTVDKTIMVESEDPDLCAKAAELFQSNRERFHHGYSDFAKIMKSTATIEEEPDDKKEKSDQKNKEEKKESQAEQAGFVTRFFNSTTEKIESGVVAGAKAVANNPRTSLLAASLGTVGYLGLKYNYNDKFRKKVNESCDNCYYDLLEKGYNVTTRISNLRNRQLKVKDLFFASLFAGTGFGIYKLFKKYNILSKLNNYANIVEDKSKNLINGFSDSIYNNPDTVRYGIYGFVVGGILTSIFRNLSKPIFAYQESMNEFIDSLSSSQIESIGLDKILLAADNPEIFNRIEILSKLNSSQKSELNKIIREYKKQQSKLKNIN